MKFNFIIREIDKVIAITFVQEHHYSKVMPKLTKHYLGIFDSDNLVGVLTLGWGTKPLHTIKKLFPKCTTSDYYEIGKMCMHPDMPRNSESQMLSSVIKWMKANLPERKFLYTWADGIVGKPGYVYQAANFYYGGYIWTDVYIGKDGEKIHPRTTKSLCQENAEFSNKEKIFWLTYDFMKSKGIKKVKGKQFRYIIPLNKTAQKEMKESTVKWTKDYPKHKDLIWKEMIGEKKYRETTTLPNFNLSVVNVNTKNVNSHKKSSLMNFFDEETVI